MQTNNSMNSIYFYKYHKFLAKFRRTGRSLVSYLVLSMFLVMKGSAQTRFLVGHNHGASTTWERIATLPASTFGTGDMLRIKIDGGSVAASGKYTMQLHLGNRGGFYGYVTDVKGNYSTYSSIECYEQGDNSIEVYLKMADENWHAAAVECWASGWGANPTLYSSPTSSTTTPSGTLVFTSATAIPAFYIQQSGKVGVGIVTIPRSKLEVVSGDANTNADPAGFAANFTSATPVSEAEATISLESNSAIAANTGGVLGFGGRYSGTQYANWASIKGLKEDATAGNYGGYLSFATRPNGGVNTERMRILSNGNVGIGTTSPGTYNLNVAGTGYYGGQLTVDGFGNNSGISFRDGYTTNVGIRAKAIATANRDGLEFLGFNGFDFSINNGSSVAMHIDGSLASNLGNVGIGTTNPTKNLEIGADHVTATVKVGESYFGNCYTANNGWALAYTGSRARYEKLTDDWRVTGTWGNNGWATILYGGAQGEMRFLTDDGTGNTDRVYTSAQFNSKTKMTITGGGNVGIGTPAPISKVHINAGPNRNLLFRPSSEFSAGFEGMTIQTVNDANNAHVPLYMESSALILNAGTGANVLIGKNSQLNSAYKLDVNGIIRANKVVVNTTGADFVFDSSYQLPTLETVENFVKKEKHLPNIATAAEMQQNGLDVGDNQIKILQKVEELTLYVIAMNKTLKEQKAVIEQQQEELNKLKEKLKGKAKGKTVDKSNN